MWAHLFWWRWLVTARWGDLFLIAWLADASLREGRQLVAGPEAYLSDKNKLLELPAQLLALSALASTRLGFVEEDTAAGGLAAGVTLLWVSQLLRLLSA